MEINAIATIVEGLASESSRVDAGERNNRRATILGRRR
jgi:hypothetical protein